ncbi:hypothetical protein STEG23_019256 [Scotinomys teguina]
MHKLKSKSIKELNINPVKLSLLEKKVQNQGYELPQPNIHSICDLLEHVKGQVLHTQSYRIARTQGNNSISKGSRSEGPVSMVKQKPKALN